MHSVLLAATSLLLLTLMVTSDVKKPVNYIKEEPEHFIYTFEDGTRERFSKEHCVLNEKKDDLICRYPRHPLISIKESSSKTTHCQELIMGMGITCGLPTGVGVNSPISILLSKDFNINDDIRTVAFNLDLSSVSDETIQITTWKASAEAPLLVFDPEHKGEIKDAAMLFGNWTFGGKKDNTPWRDGYEALATLDANGDGKISNKELAPLGLWFDYNRNGISEAGEVKRISEFGISTLYYKGAHRYDDTPDLKLEIGYKRVLNNKTIYGPSIDWYGKVRNIK